MTRRHIQARCPTCGHQQEWPHPEVALDDVVQCKDEDCDASFPLRMGT